MKAVPVKAAVEEAMAQAMEEVMEESWRRATGYFCPESLTPQPPPSLPSQHASPTRRCEHARSASSPLLPTRHSCSTALVASRGATAQARCNRQALSSCLSYASSQWRTYPRLRRYSAASSLFSQLRMHAGSTATGSTAMGRTAAAASRFASSHALMPTPHPPLQAALQVPSQETACRQRLA